MKRSDWLINKAIPKNSKDAGFKSMLDHELGKVYLPYGTLVKATRDTQMQHNTYEITTPGRTQVQRVKIHRGTGEIIEHTISEEDNGRLRPMPTVPGGFRDAEDAFERMGQTMDQMSATMDRAFSNRQAIDNTDLNALLRRASGIPVVENPVLPRPGSQAGISQRQLDQEEAAMHEVYSQMYDAQARSPLAHDLEPTPPPMRMVREGAVAGRPGVVSRMWNSLMGNS